MDIPQTCIEQLKNNWTFNSVETDEFASLDFGDIIYAKRYTSEEERKRIRLGHEVGPFLVIKNNGDTVEALLGTTSKLASYNHDFAHLLMYNTLDKDGFYRLNEKRIITRDMYISYLGKLTKKELLKLQETLIKYRNLDNKVGDIIVYCDDYYVISDISEELELYKLKEDNTNFVIGIKDKTYAVSKEKIVVPKIQKLVYTGYSLESISFQKEIKDYRGCIINYKNKLYYVYGVNSNKLNCFRVVQNEECLEQFRIVSDANIYEALWNNKKNILVDANYEIVDQVSKEEIEKTKDNKKRALKQVCRHPASNPGANWVVRKNSAANKYIVVRRVDDILYLVDINDLRIGIFDNIIIDDASDYKSLYKLNEIKRLSFFESDTNYDTAKEKCYILSKQNAISEQ